MTQIARLTGYGDLHYNGEQPLYNDSFIDPDGVMHPVEVEFLLPHICQHILHRAPNLALAKAGTAYTCVLKEGQSPAHGASLIEAVFRAFAEAKTQALARA